MHYNQKLRHKTSVLEGAKWAIVTSEVFQHVIAPTIRRQTISQLIDQLSVIAQVCRTWKLAVDAIKIEWLNQGKLSLANFSHIRIKDDLFTFITTHKKSLQAVDLFDQERGFLGEWRDYDLEKLFSQVPGLKRLHVHKQKIDEETLSLILQFSELEYLEIECHEIECNPEHFNKLKKLHHLRIHSDITNFSHSASLDAVKTVDFDLWATKSLSFPSLESLKINGLNLQFGNVNYPKALKELIVPAYKVTNEIDDLIQQLPHLEKLVVCEGGGRLPDIAHLSNLRVLEIIPRRSRSSGTIFSPHYLAHLQNLKKLNLYVYGTIPSLKKLGNLHVLVLIGSVKFKPNSLKPLENLKVLRLNPSIKSSLPNLCSLLALEVLELSNFQLPSENPFKTLINLKRLELTGCFKDDTDDFISPLINLELLSLSRGVYATQNQIQMMPLLGKLTELYLFHVQDLKDIPEIKFSALRKFRIAPVNDSLAELYKMNPNVKFEIIKSKDPPWEFSNLPSSEQYDDQYLD